MKSILFLIRGYLTIPIQTQLFEKQITFFEFFAGFFRSRINLKNFEREDDPLRFFIFEIMDFENVVR